MAAFENVSTIAAFFAFLAHDIERHPENLAALPESFLQRIAELTCGVDIDPNAALVGDVAL